MHLYIHLHLDIHNTYRSLLRRYALRLKCSTLTEIIFCNSWLSLICFVSGICIVDPRRALPRTESCAWGPQLAAHQARHRPSQVLTRSSEAEESLSVRRSAGCGAANRELHDPWHCCEQCLPMKMCARLLKIGEER